MTTYHRHSGLQQRVFIVAQFLQARSRGLAQPGPPKAEVQALARAVASSGALLGSGHFHTPSGGWHSPVP